MHIIYLPLSVGSPIHPSIHPSIHLLIYQSIHLPIHPFTHPPTYSSLHPPFIHLPIYPSMHPSTRQPARRLSARPPVLPSVGVRRPHSPSLCFLPQTFLSPERPQRWAPVVPASASPSAAHRVPGTQQESPARGRPSVILQSGPLRLCVPGQARCRVSHPIRSSRCVHCGGTGFP